jgi:ATP-dependent RNA helicase MSS116
MLTSRLDAFRLDTVLGGSSIIPQRERLDPVYAGSGVGLKKNVPYGGVVDLLVATPGRLIEHLENADMGAHFAARLKGVEVLVLDEVDCLLDGGFAQNIATIIAAIPAARQTLAFSATVPKKLLPTLFMALRPDHVVVDCVGEEVVDTHALVTQKMLIHPLELSLLALLDCIRDEMKARPDDFKILAFLPTARQTQFSAAVMTQMGLEVLEIHSRRSAGERVAASDTFRLKAKQVMLSSDVSARGVDYPDVTAVLQVGAPGSREVYIQRLGRTGRAGKAGSGTLLLCDYEVGFLEQLKGLPIEESRLAAPGPDATDALATMVEVAAAAGRVDDDLATQTYRAWLMAMVGQRKVLKWSKQDMVNNANLFAAKCLGRAQVPPMARDEIVKMGLAGLAGINMIEGVSEHEESPSGGEEVVEFELKVVINKRDMAPVLQKDTVAAEKAIRALSEVAVLALQTAIDADGSAEVSGDDGAVFKILKGWLDAKKVPIVKKPISRSSSSASFKALERNMSSFSLCSTEGGMGSRNVSSASLSSLAASPLGAGKYVPDPAALKTAEGRVAAAGAALGKATRAVAEAAEAEPADAVMVAAAAATRTAALQEVADAKAAKASLMKGK